MNYDWIISKGQALRNVFDNKEARQSIIIAITPILLLAGYYALIAQPWENQKDSSVLSITDTASTPDIAEVKSDNNQSTPSATLTEIEIETPSQEIKIDISGAVVSPGLKVLMEGDRVADALDMAGGLTIHADKHYIAQALNLAQPLYDGDKIYLPTYYDVSQSLLKPVALADKVGDPLQVVQAAANKPNKKEAVETNGDDEKGESAELININEASIEQLDTLPGIGPKFASYIVEHRPYDDTNDLCQPEIVSRTDTCQEIQKLITVK